jgi:hypothetical protein
MGARFWASLAAATVAVLGIGAGTPASAAPSTAAGVAVAAASQDELQSVSCTGPKSCVAVGMNEAANHGNGAVLAETWDGTRWTVDVMKPPSGSLGSTLSGISCLSAKSCVAVGYYFYYLPDQNTRDVGFAEVWNGAAWRLVKFAQAARDSAVPQAVSCVSAKSCVAVGEMLTSENQFAFAETWNGTAWKTTTVPEPANTISNLTGVSCTSPKFCIAVDAYNPHALVQSWNGQAWKIVKVPESASTGPSLSAVTCLTAKFCVATGTHYPNPKHFSAIALAWHGSAWQSMSVPSPGPGYANLASVSCATVKSCLAVGEYHFGPYLDSGQEYAASWNGKAWKLDSLPAPPGGGKGKGSSLTDVTCLSATDCAAVGSAGEPGSNVTSYSAFWNGRGWKFIRFP